jgi:hypothetical protein
MTNGQNDRFYVFLKTNTHYIEAFFSMAFTRRLSRQVAHVYYQLQKCQDGGWLPTVASA